MAEDNLATLKIAIEASLKDFSSKMGEFESVLKGTEDATKSTKNSFGELTLSMAAGMLAAQAAARVFSELKNAVVEGVKGADDEILAMIRLKAAIGSGAEAVLKYAEAREKSTRFAHDDTLAAADSLTIHKLNREEIEKLLPVIEDFAARKGRSAVDTAEAFGRAIEYGTMRGLRPYGIEVEKNGSQQQIFNALLKAGEGNVKGMAEQMGQAGLGPQKIFMNQLHSIGEEFGNKIIPYISDIVKNIGPGLLSFFEKLSSVVDKALQGIGAFAKHMGYIAGGMDFDDALIRVRAESGYYNKGTAEENTPAAQRLPAMKSLTPSGTSSKLGTTPLGGAKEKKDSPIIEKEFAYIDAQLTEYKDQITLGLAYIESAYKQSNISIKDYYDQRAIMIKEEGGKEEQALRTKASLEVNAVKQRELLTQADHTALETKVKLVKLQDEENDTLKKQTELQQKIEQLKTLMGTQQEGVSEAGVKDPVKALEQRQAKELRVMQTTLAEYLKLAKKSGQTDVEIEKETSKQKMAIRQKEQQDSMLLEQARQQSNLLLAQQTANSIATLANDMYEATGKKNQALWEVSKQASAISAVINGALGLTKCIADMGMPWGAILGALALGIGITEAAIIEQKQYPKAAAGGIIYGPSHSAGGVNINMEGGEGIINAAATRQYGARAIHAINAGLASVSPGGGPAGAGGTTVHITNLQDPRLIDRHMATAEGKASYLNFMGQNKTAIRAKLGV